MRKFIHYNGLKFEIDYCRYTAYAYLVGPENQDLRHLVIPSTIPEGNTNYIVNIDSSMTPFSKFRSLESISLDGDNPFLMMEDGNLYQCSKQSLLWVHPETTSYRISDSTTAIALDAFTHAKSLQTLEFSNYFETIYPYNLDKCPRLETLIIPAGVKYIGSEAFQNCRALKNVTLPQSLKWIEPNAFKGCRSLSAIKLPRRLSRIAGWAFADTGLTEIRLPNSVQAIGRCAFSGCRKLSKVRLSGNILHIGNRAFLNCRELTAIDLPASLTTIGKRAFANCDKLTQFNVHPDNKYFRIDDRGLYDKQNNCYIQPLP